jgi:hypothetical protein
MASSSVLPAAQPLESAWKAAGPSVEKIQQAGRKIFEALSRSDQTGDHSISADGSNGAGVGDSS